MIACRPLAACCALLTTAGAQAGGHFDVDDAGTLAPGQCQYELWGSRTGHDPAITGIHIGPACAVGPVEIGLGADRFSASGERTVAWVGPQAKWTFYGQGDNAALAAALSAGVVFDVTGGGRAGGQFALPVSWNALDNLQLSVNLGYDWLPGPGTRTGRGGAQAVWAVNDAVSLVAERNRAFGFWTSRLGARVNVTPTLSIDVSAGRIGTQSGNLRSVVIGVNQTFGSQ
ncbi:MAG: hypothetical protein ABWZ88_16360 [Variovorax sp.]